jgi:hypothetical protein
MAGATSLRLDPFLSSAVRSVQLWTGGVNSNVVFLVIYAPPLRVPTFGHSLKLCNVELYVSTCKGVRVRMLHDSHGRYAASI